MSKEMKNQKQVCITSLASRPVFSFSMLKYKITNTIFVMFVKQIFWYAEYL